MGLKTIDSYGNCFFLVCGKRNVECPNDRIRIVNWLKSLCYLNKLLELGIFQDSDNKIKLKTSQGFVFNFYHRKLKFDCSRNLL